MEWSGTNCSLIHFVAVCLYAPLSIRCHLNRLSRDSTSVKFRMICL
uniref:Uncharacterized protein n=1 Tax=Arundo donax TaxID=35708 RepID=A0A0A9FVB1_ARUDO